LNNLPQLKQRYIQLVAGTGIPINNNIAINLRERSLRISSELQKGQWVGSSMPKNI
jgi:hypothetical protein